MYVNDMQLAPNLMRESANDDSRLSENGGSGRTSVLPLDFSDSYNIPR